MPRARSLSASAVSRAGCWRRRRPRGSGAAGSSRHPARRPGRRARTRRRASRVRARGPGRPRPLVVPAPDRRRVDIAEGDVRASGEKPLDQRRRRRSRPPEPRSSVPRARTRRRASRTWSGARPPRRARSRPRSHRLLRLGRPAEDVGRAGFRDHVHVARGRADVGPRPETARELLDEGPVSPQQAVALRVGEPGGTARTALPPPRGNPAAAHLYVMPSERRRASRRAASRSGYVFIRVPPEAGPRREEWSAIRIVAPVSASARSRALRRPSRPARGSSQIHRRTRALYRRYSSPNSRSRERRERRDRPDADPESAASRRA